MARRLRNVRILEAPPPRCGRGRVVELDVDQARALPVMAGRALNWFSV